MMIKENSNIHQISWSRKKRLMWYKNEKVFCHCLENSTLYGEKCYHSQWWSGVDGHHVHAIRMKLILHIYSYDIHQYKGTYNTQNMDIYVKWYCKVDMKICRNG